VSRPLWLALGYELAADGFAPAGHHGAALRASWANPGWEAAITAAFGIPVENDAQVASVRMQRARSAATLAAVLPLDARWSLSGGAHAGVLLQRRETREPEADVVATPARWSAAFALGPELGVRMRSGSFGIGLTAALDWLPSPTRFVYERGDQAVEAPRPWRVQPRMVLAAEVSP
jgi:hypothetical protein